MVDQDDANAGWEKSIHFSDFSNKNVCKFRKRSYNPYLLLCIGLYEINAITIKRQTKKWQIDNIKGNEAEARSQKVQMIDIEMALILNTLREEVSNNNKIEWRPKKKRTKPTVAIENLRLSNGIFLAIQYNDRTTKKTESKKKPKCKRHLTKMYCQRPVDLER